jgi:hypothetical protein
MKVISKKEAESLGLRKYYTGIPCKRGHLSERFIGNGGCCQCKYENEKANPEIKKINDKKYRENHKIKIMEKQKEWVKNNPEKNAATKRRYKEANQEKVRLSSLLHYTNNKEKILKYSREWSQRNKDKRMSYASSYKERHREKSLKSKREYNKRFRGNNPELARERDRAYYRANPERYFIRTSIARIVKYMRDKDNRASVEVVGYGHEVLKQRLEFQFKDGMSWENYGEWHIDHKKPVARFIDQGITDPKVINALSNLQPLWARDNLEKSDKWIYG